MRGQSIFRTLQSQGTAFCQLGTHLYKDFEASDHRDKLYAVSDFADHIAYLGFEPDYEYSLKEAYTYYATRLMEESNYPVIVHIAGFRL